MASATVGSPRPSCQRATGSWLVTIVERRPQPVLDHLEEIRRLGVGERLQGEVVENENVDPGPGREQARQRPSRRAVASSVRRRGTRR